MSSVQAPQHKKQSLQMPISNDKHCLFLHLVSLHSMCPQKFSCSVYWTNGCRTRIILKFLNSILFHSWLLNGSHCERWVKENVSPSVVSDSLWPHGLEPTRLFCLWNSPGKNNGVGSHPLLLGIFLTQGLSLSLLHCRQILYPLSHQGSPELEKASLSLPA